VLMSDTPIENARRVAENLRQAVERIRIRKTATGETMRTITVSCGVALLQREDAPIDLVDRADAALYLAKEAGRNRVIVSAACSAEAVR
jgi:diguanylate cyclase